MILDGIDIDYLLTLKPYIDWAWARNLRYSHDMRKQYIALVNSLRADFVERKADGMPMYRVGFLENATLTQCFVWLYPDDSAEYFTIEFDEPPIVVKKIGEDGEEIEENISPPPLRYRVPRQLDNLDDLSTILLDLNPNLSANNPTPVRFARFLLSRAADAKLCNLPRWIKCKETW